LPVSRRALAHWLCGGALALSLLPASSEAKKPNQSPVGARSSVVTVLAGNRQGTAFAFRHRDELLTNAHVVRGTTHVDVLLRDGTRVTGTVVALDDTHDLATIKAPIDLPALQPADRSPAVGTHVVAIGSPLGLSGSVTEGVVSAVRRRPGSGRLIQTDLSVNPGNSGGPLLDSQRRVLGVTSSRAAAGISFAVPIAYAAQLASHPYHPAPRGGTSLLLIVALALALLLLAAVAVVLLRRRAARPPAPIEVRLRPGAQIAPPAVFEPEPQVELKPRQE
jgi:S1-C subfamily serine protease